MASQEDIFYDTIDEEQFQTTLELERPPKLDGPFSPYPGRDHLPYERDILRDSEGVCTHPGEETHTDEGPRSWKRDQLFESVSDPRDRRVSEGGWGGTRHSKHPKW